MTAALEAEFAAIEVVLSHAEDGELAWPDVEQDLDAFRDCARAASKLGWLGNDGAPEPPQPVGEVDSFLIGYGGWLTADTADPAAHLLAMGVVEAEREYRAGQWEALATWLSHTGDLAWPDDAVERAELFAVCEALHWPPPSAGTRLGRGWHPMAPPDAKDCT